MIKMIIELIEKAHNDSVQNNNEAFLPDKGVTAILTRESALIAMVRQLEADKAGLVEALSEIGRNICECEGTEIALLALAKHGGKP